MMLASKYGNEEVLKFLISCGLNVNKKDGLGSTASDYAWENKNLACLIQLLNADAPFPKQYGRESGNLSDVKDNVMDKAAEMQNFHENIREGNLTEVQSFVRKNPNLRFAYNQRNQCALTTALAFQQLEIYGFLRSVFYEPGVDSEIHNSLISQLPECAKKWLRLELKQHFNKPVEDHVMKLLSKSRDRSGSKENFKKLVDFYENLNSISQIRPILELVATAESTYIVFDFTNEGVIGLDPMADGNPVGLTYHSGYILIGAGRDDDEVLATIAHELTHSALQIVYNNKCQPFHAGGDNAQQQVFEKIVQNYSKSENLNDVCPIIGDVYERYTKHQWNEELIARVPQLYALHNHASKNTHSGLKLKACQIRFKELFDFYEKIVLEDLKRYLQLLDKKKAIRDINKEFGVLKTVLELDMLSGDCQKIIEIRKRLFVKTSLPYIALEAILKQLRDRVDESHIFVEFEQMCDPENMKMLEKAAASDVNPTFFIIDSKSSSKIKDISETLLTFLQGITFLFIASNQIGCFKELHSSEKEISFKWNDLNARSKLKIMQSKIIFQDSEVILEDIVENQSLFCASPLEQVLEALKTGVDSFNVSLPKAPPLMIERKFYAAHEDTNDRMIPSKDKLFVSSDLCDMLSEQKTVLIADSAGMGKSTSAAQLARDLKKKNPCFWVAFIDLKQHTKAFAREDQQQPENIDAEYIGQKLFKLTTIIEEKIFNSCYESGKIIFIIDAFDEISPNYKQFVTLLLKSIKLSQNQLLVTTRPHFARELGIELKTKAIKLLPFSRSDQIEFLTAVWQNKTQETGFKSKVEEILNQLRFAAKYSDFYSVPIHIFMLAEAFEDQDLSLVGRNDFNTLTLYKRFITMKISIWNKKGPLADNDSIKLHQCAVSLQQIFYKLALEQLFGAEKMTDLGLPKIPDDVMDEMIARVGIVAYGPGGLAEFIHRTFAEYFAAEFIFESVLIKKPQYSNVELFVKVIMKGDFGQVRRFINDRLQNVNEKLETGPFAKFIEDSTIRGENYYSNDQFFDHYSEDSDSDTDETYDILGYPVREKLTYLIKFILQTLDFDYTMKVEFVKEILHEAVGFYESFMTLWSCVENFVGQNDINKIQKQLLLHVNKENIGILESAIIEEYVGLIENVQYLLDIAKASLNEEQFLKFFYNEDIHDYPFGFALKISNDTFSVLWDAARCKLGIENQKKLLTGKDKKGMTCLHCNFYSDSDGFSDYLKIIKELLNPNELNKLLTARDNRKRLFTHFALENMKLEQFKTIFKFVEENATQATKKELILSEDRNKRILIEASFCSSRTELIDYVFDMTESLLIEDGKNIIDFFRERGSLSHVILNFFANSKVTFDKCAKKLEGSYLRKILLDKTLDGQNIVSLLVESKNQNDAIRMWYLIIRNLNDPKEGTVLLFDSFKWMAKNNFFRHVAQRKNCLLMDLLQLYKKVCGHVYLKEIFFKQDEDGSTVLHFLAKSGHESSIRILIAFLSKTFSVEERQEMFTLKNKANKIPFQEILETDEDEKLEELEAFKRAHFDIFDARILENAMFDGTIFDV